MIVWRDAPRWPMAGCRPRRRRDVGGVVLGLLGARVAWRQLAIRFGFTAPVRAIAYGCHLSVRERSALSKEPRLPGVRGAAGAPRARSHAFLSHGLGRRTDVVAA